MTDSTVCATEVCFSRSRSTGKERDTESGLDDFGARYYASTMGRFMSPDWSAKEEPVPYAKLDNRQSLNLYSYVLNNPLSEVDVDGHTLLGQGGPGLCEANAAGNGCSKGASDLYQLFASQNQTQQQNNTNGYGTQDGAAIAALTAVNPASIKANLEYAGWIYKDQSGNYHYSEPVVGSETHGALGALPDGATAVGDYHTHGDYSIAGAPGEKPVRTSDPKQDDFNSDHFSGYHFGAVNTGDKPNIESRAKGTPGYTGYLGTPSGTFLRYDPVMGKESVLQ